MINRLAKTFLFNEDNRSEIVFSEPNKIRMNPDRNSSLANTNSSINDVNEERRISGDGNDQGAELTLSSSGYSLDKWLYVRTPVTNPKGVKNWIGFDVDVQIPEGTSILYKPGSIINNVEEDYFHDGLDWRLSNEETRASGTITIDDYSLLSGATIEIDGYKRKEGEQWVASTDNETTAASIESDLANFTSIRVERSINQITIYSENLGIVGNNITMVTDATSGITLSGPTLTGGLDGEFNTFDEIQQNISTLLNFIINTRGGDKTIYWRANLRTTSSDVTPVMHAIKLLGEYEVEWFEDIIYDTMLQSLHNNIRCTFDYEISLPSTTDTIDLSLDEYIPNNDGYNITGVESVYNMSLDPHRINNILDDYVPGSINEDGETYKPGVITLKNTAFAGDIIWAKITIVPEFAITTNQDFYEVVKFPAIVFEDIRNVTETGSTSNVTSEQGKDAVRDFINGTAVEIQPPAVNDLRFEYVIFTSNPVDLTRLITAMDEYFTENRVIRTNALDELVTMQHLTSATMQQSPDLNDVNTAKGVFILRSVPFYLKKSLDVPLVTNLNMTFAST